MLTKKLQQYINKFIMQAFSNLRGNLLGPDHVPTGFIFSLRNFDPSTTLGAAYTHANAVNSIDPKSIDKSMVAKLKDVAANYIDSLEQKTQADLTRIVGESMDNLSVKAKVTGQSMDDIAKSKEGKAILKEMASNLNEHKDKIVKSVDLLVNHELYNAQNVGCLDGILGISKSLGIDDPVVFKIGVLDDKRCKYCWSLWTLDDKITPKLYKLSELRGAPGSPKDPVASVSPTHINCRDILTVLMPGFGFDGGKIVYKGHGHDEYKVQRGL